MQKYRFTRRLAPVAAFALLIVALVSVNVLAGLLPLRFDATEQNLYTLSQGSKNILESLEQPLTLKFYYSSSLGTAPVSVKNYARKVSELLDEYEANGGGNVTLQTYDPKPDTEDEEWAVRYGLNGVHLPDGNRLFFGMVVLAEDREAAIPFFDPRREKFLEYDISQVISQLKDTGRKKIGVISTLPVMGGMASPQGPRMDRWTFIDELQKAYEVEQFDTDSLIEVPEDVETLLVIHPKGLSPQASYALDQFLVRGGKMVLFLDPHARLDATQPGGFMNMPEPSDLPTLRKAWGIDYNNSQIVADQALATRVSSPNQGPVDYPVWLTLNRSTLNQELVPTSELEELTLIDAGAFAPAEGFAYSFTPLMETTANSGELEVLDVRFSTPLDVAKKAKGDGKQRVLAALVTGTFKTAYPDGWPKPQPDPKDKDAKVPDPPGQPFLAQGEKETSLVLVGDSDFMADNFSVRRVSFFGNNVAQPINDNLNFVLNTVEFLMGSQDLIHVRSRGQFSRPFTLVQKLQSQAAQRYQQEEQALSERLTEVRQRLEALQGEKQGQDVILSPEQLEEIRKFRLEEQETQRELREVRKVLRQDIERLGNILLTVNLAVMPLLVAIVGFVVIFRRAKRRGGKQ